MTQTFQIEFLNCLTQLKPELSNEEKVNPEFLLLINLLVLKS